MELVLQWDKIKKKNQEIENKVYEENKIQMIVYFRVSGQKGLCEWGQCHIFIHVLDDKKIGSRSGGKPFKAELKADAKALWQAE